MITLTEASFGGGQGKTTLTIFLAKKLALRGHKVLVIDADPQASLTFYMGHEVDPTQPSLLEVIQGKVAPIDAVYSTSTENISIIPADDGLQQAQSFMADKGGGVLIIRKRLEALAPHFDVTLIDSPPQGFQLSQAAIAACDLLIILAEAHSKGVKSMLRTLNAVNELAEFGMFRGEVLGIVPFKDKWVGRSQAHTSAGAIASMKENAGDIRVWPSVIESEAFRKSLDMGKIPSDFDPKITHSIDLIVAHLEEKCLTLTPSIA